MATLEERVQRLEDESAIKRLKARYCAACDASYDADGIADLFVADGVWDGAFMGRFEGQAAIRAHFATVADVMGFAIHHVTNPLIEVVGDTATGQWYLWQPCTQTRPRDGAERALWLAARYEETYRRMDGGWRFVEMIIHPRLFAPYEGGWAETKFVAGGPRDV